MPRKIQRASALRPQLAITDRGAAILAIAHLGAETTKAAAQVYTATANVLATTVQSLAECGKAYFSYLEECQRTRQVEIWSSTVIAEAREHTRRIEIQAVVLMRQAQEHTRQMEIQAAVLIRQAQEHTRQIQIQADVTLQQLSDTQSSREARMEVVRTFLSEHHRLHELLIHQSGSGMQNLSVEERVHLTKYRDEVLQRLRELEAAITSLVNSL